MIKKLRLKFILISMISVFLVLGITVGAMNVANYVATENNSQTVLKVVIEQGTEDFGPQPFNPDGPKHDNVELRQQHYFIVAFNKDGSLNSINNTHMFIMTQEECVSLAKKVFDQEMSGGKYGDFRYQMAQKDDGLIYVGFVDMKERFDSALNYLILSFSISAGAYLVLFALIFFGSKIVFKPTEEAYKNQKRFITNASHELKTPLTIISADLDLIELDKGKDEWTNSIRDQVKRLNEMTNQLVTLSKLEEEDNRFPFEDFSLNEVCLKAIDAFKSSFKKENIKFGSNITGNITMYGNRYLINELIYLFLDNSLKYTGGDNKSSYFVVSQNLKGKIEFRFSNTLDKNDEVDVRQVLDRFYRSPSTKKEGSGIGLSVGQEIVKLHKGKIDVDKNNNSITFVITFNC